MYYKGDFMRCKLCNKRTAYADHHFDGEEIQLENLSEEKLERYKEYAQNGHETLPVCTICHSEIHGNETSWSQVKKLYKLRRDVIELRKATGNKIMALEEYEMDVSDLKEIVEGLSSKEKEIGKRLKQLVHKEDIWNWLQHVSGIGEINTAGLIAKVETPEKFDTISKLWKYLGQMPKSGFDPEGKYKNYQHYRQATKDGRTLTSYDIGSSFIKSGDFYRDIYDERRRKTEADKRFGDLEGNKSHYHNDARKVAVKKFLSHLWLVWRKMKGLEITEPYIIAKKGNGHNRFIEPPHLEKVDIKI